MPPTPYDLQALSRLMDAVDGIHSDLQPIHHLPEHDDVLLSKVREVYLSQGLSVEPAVLNAAFLKVYGREPGAPGQEVAASSSSLASTLASRRKKRIFKMWTLAGISVATVGFLLSRLTSIQDPKQVLDILTGLSFLTGIGLGSLSLIRLKDYAEGGRVMGEDGQERQNAVPLSTPIVLMVLSLVLIAIPAYMAQLSVLSIG